MREVGQVSRTGMVARRLGVQIHQIKYWLQKGLLSPQKDSAGQYVWSEADIQRAGRIIQVWRGSK